MFLRGAQQGLGLLLSYWGTEMQVSQTVQDFNPGFPGFSLTKHDKKCHKNKLFIQFGATKLLQFAKYTLFFHLIPED